MANKRSAVDQFTEEDRKVIEYGILHNLGIRYKEASQHLLHDYDQLLAEAAEYKETADAQA